MDDTRFMLSVSGKSPDDMSLTDADTARLWALLSDGKAKVIDGLIQRVPVAYGDGKKSRYGVTYADECNDLIL